MALTNRTLVILKYLWETTDETHPVSLADISAYLEQYEITADPRTLRKDIEQLIEFGIDIVKDRKVQNLYKIIKEGGICCLKVGRAYRIPKAHLFSYLCIGMQTASAEA